MSEATLTNLRDYLFGTLTPANMLWLADQLTRHAEKDDANFPLKRYTMEEIDDMLDEAEAEIEAGLGTSHEEEMRAWDEEIAHMEQKELELEEAV